MNRYYSNVRYMGSHAEIAKGYCRRQIAKLLTVVGGVVGYDTGRADDLPS